MANPYLNCAPPPHVKRPRLVLLRAATAAVLVVGVTAASAGAAAASVNGPDVSSHNHDNGGKVDWHVMHKVGGTSFSFVKATEGVDYVNPSFASDVAALRAHKLIRGSYHFAKPGGGTSSQIVANATSQANFFLGATGALAGPGNLPPVLDFEDAGSLSPSQLTLWASAWLTRVKTVTGRTPILYTYPSFWKAKTNNSTSFAANPLWLASYGVSKPPQVGGWKSYTFWQYTDRARLTGSGRPVDMSVFNGSLTQLNAMTSVPNAKSAKPVKPGRPGQPRKSVPPVPSLPQLTLRYTTRVERKPVDTRLADKSRAGGITSRSSLRTSLRLFGLDGSHLRVGY